MSLKWEKAKHEASHARARAARGSEASLWIIWDWLMGQSSPDVDEANKGGAAAAGKRQAGTRVPDSDLPVLVFVDCCRWAVKMR